NSAYHSPTLRNRRGVTRVTTPSVSAFIASAADADATGTASVSRAGIPARTVLAVPVASAQAVEVLKAETDEVVTLVTPRRFRSVGEWYAEFGQLTDSDVLTLLAALR
ncbi:MAG: hypothetical protein WAK58_10050, partial [Trebonia sp.]